MSRSDEQRLTDIIEAAREVLGLVSHGKDAWDTDRGRAERLADGL